MLLRWARAKPGGSFVFTSNVDGQFQAAGVPADRVVECHGSLHHLPCGDQVWPADGVTVSVDGATTRAADPPPACPGAAAWPGPTS